jgi:calcineurin-like phosphoesterase family protein
MSTLYFIADLHFGHKNAPSFANNIFGKSLREYEDTLIARWNSRVHKNDNVWVLGDAAFNKCGLLRFNELNGTKILVRGNHDKLNIWTYLNFFTNVHGITKKNQMWISHAPIHPAELRDKPNIHGHVHFKTLPDKRYVNVSACVLDGYPINYEEILEKLK